MRRKNTKFLGIVAVSPIPWHVLIWDDFSPHTCGGVILDHLTILTASKCFDSLDRELYFIFTCPLLFNIRQSTFKEKNLLFKNFCYRTCNHETYLETRTKMDGQIIFEFIFQLEVHEEKVAKILVLERI